jgi:hypothetical protein
MGPRKMQNTSGGTRIDTNFTNLHEEELSEFDQFQFLIREDSSDSCRFVFLRKHLKASSFAKE